MLASVTTLDVGLSLLGLCLVAHVFMRRRSGPLPPGPRGLPLIGNLLDLPTEKDWITFSQWKKIWGDLVSASVLGRTTVIINSYEKAIEILDKKSAIYSDRPVVWMGGELLGYKDTLGLLAYGPRFRVTRKLIHQELGTPSAIKSFHLVEEEMARRCVGRITKNPDNLRELLIKHAGAIILRIVYGYDVKDGQDDLVDIVNKGMDEFSMSISPAAFSVNQIPWLRFVPSWFPGAGFKTTAKEWRKNMLNMVDVPFDLVKQRMAMGVAEPSFVSKSLPDDVTLEREDEVKYAAVAMYGGGADTTAALLYAFFRVMTLYPDVQYKARLELDAVIGSDRLPTFEDKPNLPYIEAVCTELLRFHATIPTSLPHCTTEDDVHDGYFVAKGSTVIANIWDMTHDPERYKNPLTFNPSRFIPSDDGIPVEQDPRTITFGFGRRICPGRLLADASIFITIATTLAVLDIAPLEDDKPDGELMSGIICYPTPFKCKVTVRSAKTAELLA